MAVQIKVCGITRKEEVDMLVGNQVDYMGMVLFYPKSKRNVSIETAREILKETPSFIQKVAVVVSPSVSEIKQIQELDFDYIQIHGKLAKESYDAIKIPILKAFHVNELKSYEAYQNNSKIKGYVFDAANPGGGKTFDWSLLHEIKRDGKIFVLAGGLCADNVANAILMIQPDIVDVSSALEGENGKEEHKIKEFVEQVKQIRKKEGNENE